MASYNIPALAKLIEKFESLPGIGSKTAQRLAYHVLNMSDTQAEDFAKAITEAHNGRIQAKTEDGHSLQITVTFPTA